jgi:uncharacterized membrane protein
MNPQPSRKSRQPGRARSLSDRLLDNLNLNSILVWILLELVSLSVPAVSTSLLRIVIWIPGIILIPGYVVLAVLFPRRDELQGTERIAFSIPLSVAIVSLLGLGLNYTVRGIQLTSVAATIVVFSVLFCGVAQIRRHQLRPHEQFTLGLLAFYDELYDEYIDELSTNTTRILSLVFIIAVIALLSTTVYTAFFPPREDPLTDFFILGNNWTAEDYPKNFTVGTQQWVILGIGNHELRDMVYRVEIYAVNETLNRTLNYSSIQRMDLLEAWSIQIPRNEQRFIRQNITFRRPGYNQIEYLLFIDPPPGDSVTGNARIEQSYRNLHLWVSVH